jgi:NAD(P)-dependent dehydrogenase (short-subunit alcohol dehydrogenase family)
MSSHALIVGGTGMLRGLCLELAARGWDVSVVARRHAGLSRLRQEAAARTGRPERVNPIAADYADIGALAMGLRTAVMGLGPIELVVCYATAPMAPIVVADVVGNAARPCTFVHVVGSEAPDPARIDSARDEIAANPGISYRRVILGFMREESGSRWLTDEEICRGVACAISDSAPEQVVGVVTPWEARPRG